jgi:phytanoyl-CoA hydroxylase
LKWEIENYTGTGYTVLKESQLGERETVALPLKAGSAIFFNDRLLHKSTPNRSDEVRWSVVFVTNRQTKTLCGSMA